MPRVYWANIKHFEPAEFACKCGECDSTGYEMDERFIRMLDDMRERCGFAFPVTSGYRCPDYNDRIAKTGRRGPHTTGRAVDLHLIGEKAFYVVRQSALGGWFTGIGIMQRGPHAARFIHLDNLGFPDHPRPMIWSY